MHIRCAVAAGSLHLRAPCQARAARENQSAPHFGGVETKEGGVRQHLPSRLRGRRFCQIPSAARKRRRGHAVWQPAGAVPQRPSGAVAAAPFQLPHTNITHYPWHGCFPTHETQRWRPRFCNTGMAPDLVFAKGPKLLVEPIAIELVAAWQPRFAQPHQHAVACRVTAPKDPVSAPHRA